MYCNLMYKSRAAKVTSSSLLHASWASPPSGRELVRHETSRGLGVDRQSLGEDHGHGLTYRRTTWIRHCSVAAIDIRHQLYQYQHISTVVCSAILLLIQRSVCATKLSRLCCNVWNVLDLNFFSMGLFLFDFESLIVSLFSSRYSCCFTWLC